MRVLITGGAGFIGSHLCDALIAQGDEPIILDNLTTGSLKNIEKISDQIEIHQGDIRSLAVVAPLVSKSDLILHMAAALGVKTILENPVESISTNFTGSEVVMQAALKYNKRIIIASTSEIYGKNPNQPLKETDDRVIGAPQKIRWTYSDAKALEEAMAHALFKSHGLKVTTIRLFNTVGPRQTGRYGMVVPRFVGSAIKNEPITIYGDGSQSRVFCHVLDAVDAIIKITKENKTIGDVFNIGGEGEITVKDLAKQIISKTNSKSTITFTPYDQAYPEGFEDMPRRVPDISKIKNALGWKPLRNLNQIIGDVAEELKIAK